MGGECFDTESFSGVMAAEQEIHPKLFSSYRSPMRRFARDQRVDFFLSDLIDFRTGGARNDPDGFRLLWATIECLY